MDNDRFALDPQKYFEVASEEVHQTLDLKLVLKTQIRQLEAELQEYQAHFGDLPADAPDDDIEPEKPEETKK